MNKDSFFHDYYRVNEETGSLMVEVAINQYADIFSVWDPVPFKQRAINPDLEFYLMSSSEEIPKKHSIEIVFLIRPDKICSESEDECKRGLKRGLEFRLYLLKKQMREIYSRLLHYIILSIVFLWLGIAFPAEIENQVWESILKEGLVIGGWVFLWEAISLFSFTEFDLLLRSRNYRRLINASIFFRAVEPS